jgi:FKBP-type peptidyl-prolyl cis-trans isomerase FklB
MRNTLITVALFAAPIALAVAGESLNMEDQTTRINYSLGYQIGGDFKHQGVEMNADAVVAGIHDALSGAKPQMKPEEMRATLIELKRKVVTEQQAERRQAEQKQIEEDKQFLEKNARKEGVVITESGLQYKVVEEGTGKTPGPTDQVTVNYRGTLINGQEFDSSDRVGKPATFPLNGVIKGWTEGLQHLKEGGKIELYIPPDLGYGKKGPLANRTLVFDVELLSVGPAADASPADKTPSTEKDGTHPTE